MEEEGRPVPDDDDDPLVVRVYWLFGMIVVELGSAVVVDDEGRLVPDTFASRVQVFTCCTASCPFASLTGVKTKTHVTVTGPNGLNNLGIKQIFVAQLARRTYPQ